MTSKIFDRVRPNSEISMIGSSANRVAMNRPEDRLSAAHRITGWMHRDLGGWDQVWNLFHPDGFGEVDFQQLRSATSRLGRARRSHFGTFGRPPGFPPKATVANLPNPKQLTQKVLQGPKNTLS